MLHLKEYYNIKSEKNLAEQSFVNIGNFYLYKWSIFSQVHPDDIKRNQ